MISALGRKQRSLQSDWQFAMDHISDFVSEKELAAAVKKAKAGIRKHTKDKRAAYSWSGGKDSLVVGDICKQIGITDCVFVHTNLEYPAFLSWCLEHLPEGCEVINTAQDLDWLATRPQMLFPDNSATVSRWFGIVQRNGILQYYRRQGLDIIIEGHRKADGNFVGPEGLLKNNAGLLRFSPLADWPHEMILAYISYHELAMPPIYGWKDGYRIGTHPWPCRMGMKSARQGWQEVFDIDPDIVRQAAAKIDSAADFLREVGE